MQATPMRTSTRSSIKNYTDSSYEGTSKKKLKHKKEAIDWFMKNDPQFMQYCKILGIDSNTIRNKIVKHVPMTTTKKQKEVNARL